MSTASPALSLGKDKDNDSADELFASAIDMETNGGGSNNGNTSATSGYGTDIPKSDTMDDVRVDEEEDDNDDDDDLFKSAVRVLDPEPMKAKMQSEHDEGQHQQQLHQQQQLQQQIAGDVIDLLEEDENPFQDPQLQLSSVVPDPVLPSAVLDYPISTPPVNVEQSSNLPSYRTSILDGMDSEERNEPAGNDDFINVKVSNPRKIGDGMSSYVTYTVSTKTTMNLFKRQEMTVSRRFSDFLGLHDKLSEKYLQNGRIIPPAPDKSVVGMTKVKMGKDGAAGASQQADVGGAGGENAMMPDEFLDRRRAALERFLNRTAAHPSLRTDPDFREFLELDSDLPKANQTASLSGKNVMRFINKVGEKVTSLTIKMEETDGWFEEKCETIEQLDHQLRRLHTSTETLFEYRRALSTSTGALSKAMSALSTSEEDSELSGALSQLAVVQEKIEHVHGEQASADFYQLSEMVKDYVGLVGAVKDAFQERVKAWQQWQNATSALTKKREVKAKAELAGNKQERVGQLRQEIAEQERQQEMAQDNFEKVSRMVKKEVELFDVRRAEEFKRGVIAYLDAMLMAQESVAKHWERYLPEIQQINHKQ